MKNLLKLIIVTCILIVMQGLNTLYAQSFSTPGTHTYTVPVGVKAIKVEVWGAGGKGGYTNNRTETGGGGGGAYSSSMIRNVTSGTTYTVVVGAGSTTTAAGGDSYFGSATTVMAKGGNSVANNSTTGASGGSAASGYGDIKYSGGSGANGTNASSGGGGGSSAIWNAPGANGSTYNGGIAPGFGGDGGKGRLAAEGNGSGLSGKIPGGGGGGVYSNSSTAYSGGAGANGMVIVTNYYDSDGDGYLDVIEDKDSDNDGILGIHELYCDRTTAPNGSWPVATEPARPPMLSKQIMFFDWSGVTLSPSNPTATKSITINGVTYTATLSNFSSNVASPNNTLIGYDINTWSAGPQNMVWRYYDVNGTTFKEVLRVPTNVTGTSSVTIQVTAMHNGMEYPVDLIVFDPEATNPSSNEKVRFTTNGTAFQLLERTGEGTGDISTAVTGVGTKAIEYFDTEESKINALFVTTGYSPMVNASVTTTAASLQGIGFAVRLYCDADNDGIPSFLDTDSDNDGCYDAVEGTDDVLASQLTPDGRINSAVDGDGVPILVNAGGDADTDGLQGQGIGYAGNASYLSLACNDVVAADDSYTAFEGRQMLTESVIINDMVNGAPAVIGHTTGTVSLIPTGVWPAGIEMNTDTGQISIADTVPGGTYTLTYSMCLNGVNPANCSTATVTITVVSCAAGEVAPVIN